MRLRAQAGGGADALPDPGFTDNLVLDEYLVPFGEWMGQAKDWIGEELRWLLSAIEWPFATLNDFLVRDIMEPVSWFWIVVAFFLIGTLARNIKVGVFAGVGIGSCGFLGPESLAGHDRDHRVRRRGGSALRRSSASPWGSPAAGWTPSGRR